MQNIVIWCFVGLLEFFCVFWGVDCVGLLYFCGVCFCCFCTMVVGMKKGIDFCLCLLFLSDIY